MRYPGGKNGAGVYQWLIRQMPRHQVYVEGFAGSAAASRRKPAAHTTILIEKDPDQFQRLVDWHIQDGFAVDDRTSSRVTLTATNVAFDDGSRTIICRSSYFAWLARNRHRLNRDWLIYLDPPYLNCTGHYRCELTVKQHEKLLFGCQTLGARVMISGYSSDLYQRMLSKWQLRQRWCMTRGGLRHEHLWMNFQPSDHDVMTTLHNGDNFRERQRVKRKAERWRRNLESMPEWERQYVLEALLNE